jgi:biotin carboxyl carrier protein
MRYITTVDGETFEVEINSESEIIVSGRRLQVDFQSVADQPVYSLILDNQSYEAYVYPSDQGLDVLLFGQLYHITVEDERQRRLRQASGVQISPSGEFHLKAPMPGLVVAVPVAEGQHVEQGQHMVILESMKMQNELKSPREGTVSRVRVKPGDNVEQNQILVTLV